MSDEFAKMWEKIENDLGFNYHNMLRSRPYDGQSHTCIGSRGATKVNVTFRDIRDCYIRAYCLSMGASHEDNMIYYNEALKGENACLCENDIYALKGSVDPMAVLQNLNCEIERLMGIYPNISNHPSSLE